MWKSENYKRLEECSPLKGTNVSWKIETLSENSAHFPKKKNSVSQQNFTYYYKKHEGSGLTSRYIENQ